MDLNPVYFICYFKQNKVSRDRDNCKDPETLVYWTKQIRDVDPENS